MRVSASCICIAVLQLGLNRVFLFVVKPVKWFIMSTVNNTFSYTQVINDPVHNTIEIHPLCLKIIDTPEFQRLRYIRQCGICYLVYPSAVHSRFEHSIGVYHLATKMLDRLNKDFTTFSKEDYLCVRIAALLHDLGHGPFSHLWERFINDVRNYTEEWHHEDMSLKLFRHMIKKNDLQKEFLKYNLGDAHVELIEKIISGDVQNIDPKKLFLLEIVANKKTNIDVDRWDYLLRDAYFFGVICPVNIDRIIAYASVKEDEKTKENRIVFRDKISQNILETFQYRMKLHKICYQHRVCKRLEIMLMDALKAADKYFFEDGQTLSNCYQSVETYINLDDGLLNVILHSQKKELEESRNILNRILQRQLYTELGIITLQDKIPMKNLKAIEVSLNENKNLDLRLAQLDINMGIGSSNNPLENVVFYDKNYEICSPKDTAYSQREIKLLVFSVDNTLKEEDRTLLIEDIKKKLKKLNKVL